MKRSVQNDARQWRKLRKLTYDEVSSLETAVLFDLAECASPHDLRRAWAMEELAQRTVQDRRLLDRLLRILGTVVTVENRNGLPLGTPACAVIARTLDDAMLRSLAHAMSDWGVWHQHDFLSRFVDASDRGAVFTTLRAHGLRAKVTIGDDGEVRAQPAFIKPTPGGAGQST